MSEHSSVSADSSYTIPAAFAFATLHLAVLPGCTEREVIKLARWAWQEAQRQGAGA